MDADSNPSAADVDAPIEDVSFLVPSTPESDSFYGLDASNIPLNRIVGLAVVAVLAIAVIVGLLIWLFANGIDLAWIISASVAAVFFVVASTLAWVWPGVSHRRVSWRLDNEGLEIRYGVLWRHLVIVPLGRTQHADVSQGPLQRIFGLGTLTVHTAGTQNASVDLSGLAHQTAIELRNRIVEQRKDQHVV